MEVSTSPDGAQTASSSPCHLGCSHLCALLQGLKLDNQSSWQEAGAAGGLPTNSQKRGGTTSLGTKASLRLLWKRGNGAKGRLHSALLFLSVELLQSHFTRKFKKNPQKFYCKLRFDFSCSINNTVTYSKRTQRESFTQMQKHYIPFISSFLRCFSCHI